MTINKTECDSCGTKLNVDLETGIGICPNCGNEYTLASESVARLKAAANAKRNLEQAQAEQIAAEKRRFEDARRKQEAQDLEQKSILRRRRNVSMFVGLLTLCLMGIILGIFVIAPASRYEKATHMMEVGSYAGAADLYQLLGSYRDSQQNTEICVAMDALTKGNVSSVTKLLQAYGAQDQTTKEAKRFYSVVKDALSDWKAINIHPNDLLLLLMQRDTFDEENTLDARMLAIQACVELAGGNKLLAWKTVDDTNRLITLDEEYNIWIYAMADEGILAVTVDDGKKADELEKFGDDHADDAAFALSCYKKSFELKDTISIRERIADIYLAKADVAKALGNMTDALEYASAAVSIRDTQEAFDYLYQLQSEAVANDEDLPEAIETWDGFLKEQQKGLNEYGYSQQAQALNGKLRIAYAGELAADNDPKAAQWYQEAEVVGADITDTLISAAALAKTGALRITLRAMAIDRLHNASRADERTSQLELLRDDIDAALRQWQEADMDPQSVFTILNIADTYGVAPNTDVRDAAYQHAALVIAGGEQFLLSFQFTDWDGAEHPALVALNKDKSLACYGLSDSQTFISKASFDLSNMESPAMRLLNVGDEPSVLIEDVSQGEVLAFALFPYSGGTLQEAQSVGDITSYVFDSPVILYSKNLPGSIERRMEYRYDVSEPYTRPAITAIDWQQADYPEPSSAQDAVIRYLESVMYGTDAESAALTAAETPQSVSDLGYSLDGLQALPKPDTLLNAVSKPFLYMDDQTLALFEVTYQSAGKSVTIYLSACKTIEGWHAAGALPLENLFVESISSDAQAVLALNDVTSYDQADTGDAVRYRVLLPYPALIQLAWYPSQTENASVYQVKLFKRGSDESWQSFSLSYKERLQQSVPFALPAGVYELEVTATSGSIGDYSFTLQADWNEDIELEPNNSINAATPIELNTAWSGSLLSKSDLDIYSFTLKKPGAVTVRFAIDGLTEKEKGKEYFTIDIAFDGSQTALSQTSVSGNEAETQLRTLYLDAGKYYLQVSPAKNASSLLYSLTVSDIENIAAEREPNDTVKNATPVEPNFAVRALASYMGDTDWYVVEIDSASLLSIQITQTLLKSQKTSYKLRVLSDAAELWSGDVPGDAVNAKTPQIPVLPGVYYVQVENVQANTAEYTVQAITDTVEQVEAEPNNDTISATRVDLGQSVSGTLATLKDVDLFAFTLEQPGSVSFKLANEAEERTGSSFSIVLADTKNLQTLLSASVTGDPATQTTSDVMLDAGEYYVQVTSGARWTQRPYNLTINATSVSNAEREPNEKPETASPLPLDTVVNGQSRTTNDVDYYEFALEQDGIATLECNMSPLGNTKATYRLAVYDESGINTLAEITVAGNQHIVQLPLSLPRGVYLLCIENKQMYSNDYYVAIWFSRNDDIEIEPNDDPALATSLIPGQILSGALSRYGDSDWYELRVPSDMQLTFILSLTKATTTGKIFVRLEKNGVLAWSKTVDTSPPGLQMTMQISKGCYQLGISSDESNISYTIGFQAGQ